MCLVALSNEKPIQILQDFARDHSLGRDDVILFSLSLRQVEGLLHKRVMGENYETARNSHDPL